MLEVPSLPGEQRTDEGARWELSQGDLDKGQLAWFLEQLSRSIEGRSSTPYR
jgi:hypothetical protein